MFETLKVNQVVEGKVQSVAASVCFRLDWAKPSACCTTQMPQAKGSKVGRQGETRAFASIDACRMRVNLSCKA